MESNSSIKTPCTTCAHILLGGGSEAPLHSRAHCIGDVIVTLYAKACRSHILETLFLLKFFPGGNKKAGLTYGNKKIQGPRLVVSHKILKSFRAPEVIPSTVESIGGDVSSTTVGVYIGQILE